MGLFMKNRAMLKETIDLELRIKAPMDRSARNAASTGKKVSLDSLIPSSLLKYDIEYNRYGQIIEKKTPSILTLLSINDKNIFAIPIEIEYTFYC